MPCALSLIIMKIIATNKKAYYNYFVTDTYEAGIVLVGSEVKSLRAGKVNLSDSFCVFSGGELFLRNCHINPFEKGSFFNVDARRDRKLLMHRREIDRLKGKTGEKGLTLIPTKIYFLGSLVKVEIGHF
jgi:SsrA-binding protein